MINIIGTGVNQTITEKYGVTSLMLVLEWRDVQIGLCAVRPYNYELDQIKLEKIKNKNIFLVKLYFRFSFLCHTMEKAVDDFTKFI